MRHLSKHISIWLVFALVALMIIAFLALNGSSHTSVESDGVNVGDQPTPTEQAINS